jgi:hypothetical protein
LGIGIAAGDINEDAIQPDVWATARFGFIADVLDVVESPVLHILRMTDDKKREVNGDEIACLNKIRLYRYPHDCHSCYCFDPSSCRRNNSISSGD